MIILLSTLLMLSPVGQTSKTPVAPVPGNIQLLEGYKHTTRKGYDTSVGEFSKDGGMTIHYDNGVMAGLKAAQCLRKENCIWFKRQLVNDSEVWLGLTKEGLILATFRKDYANFYAEPKSPEDIVDFLTMVLTYRSR